MVTPTADPCLVPAENVEPSLPRVDLWFDPACPFAWVTSRWMLELEQLRQARVEFHVMSLSVLDEARVVTPEYRKKMDGFWAAVRVAVATERRHGQSALRDLYTAMGVRRHQLGQDLNASTIREALVVCGLPEDLVLAAHSDEFDHAVRASHNHGVELVGPDVGMPILLLPEGAVFGPIMTRIPRGSAAIEVWESVRRLVAHDDFFELKRTRTRAPEFD